MKKQAKVISDEQFSLFINDLMSKSKHPERDCVIFMLSFKAGLRAQEIAGLKWSDVSLPNGDLNGEILEIPNNISKGGNGRKIPMHEDIFEALKDYKKTFETVEMDDNIVKGEKVNAMSPNNLQQYIRRTYIRYGLQGCSSHSGRRTLLTKMARNANQFDCSLVDVQNVAGHKFIDTTQDYLEPSDNLTKLLKAM